MIEVQGIFNHFRGSFIDFEYANGQENINTLTIQTKFNWQLASGYIGQFSGEGLSKEKAIELATAEYYINFDIDLDIKKADFIKFEGVEYEVIEIETNYYAKIKILYMRRRTKI